MRRLLPVIVVLLAVAMLERFYPAEDSAVSLPRLPSLPSTNAGRTAGDILPGASGDDVSEIARAFREGRSNVQVEDSGTVVRVLADDHDGSRHQRFILELASGQTVLVAHNIDLAPRIGDLRTGDRVRFFGEYEWNNRGGVIHWTHDDPAGRHIDGWLEHDGRRYQ